MPQTSRVSVVRQLCAYLMLALLGLTTNIAEAEDKSGSRASLTQLPSAGGAVQTESGRFTLNRSRGAVQFELPLPELPNRAGVAPSVSITYSQQSGDDGSGFGIGWRLSVPSISLAPNTGLPAFDPETHGPAGVPLAFGGRRLIYIGDDDGRHRFVPRETEQDIRIVFHPSRYDVEHGHDLNGVKPSISKGFEVRFPDGRRQLFSGDPSIAEGKNQRITRYPLVFEVAPTGESIAYKYVKKGGFAYASSITFAGGKSVYKFDVVETDTGRVRYDRGHHQTASALYTRLIAEFDGEIHAQWCFVYDNGAKALPVLTHQRCRKAVRTLSAAPALSMSSSSLYRLRTVFRFGNQTELLKQSAQLSPIHFTYSRFDEGSVAQRDLVYRTPELGRLGTFRPEDFELADTNFDGLVDVIARTEPGRTRVYPASGEADRFYLSSQPWRVQRGSQIVSPDLKTDRFYFADLNGDTLVDLIEFGLDEGFVYVGTLQNKFEYIGRMSVLGAPSIMRQTLSGGRGRFVDVNGDGRSDVVTTMLNDTGDAAWRVYLNTSDANEISFVSHEFSFPWKTGDTGILTRSDVRFQDLNADGLTDLVMLAHERRGICLYPNLGALNLEFGKASLFGLAENGNDARCRGRGRFIDIPEFPAERSLDQLWFSDVNGDGIVDLSTHGTRFDELNIWLGTGNLKDFETAVVRSLNIPVIAPSGANGRVRIADIDGDAQAEILLLRQGTARESRAIAIDFNRTNSIQLIKPNLLTSIRYESGLQYDFKYATSVDEHERDSRLSHVDPLAPMHFPVVVVKQIVESFGAEDTARRAAKVIELLYRNPAFNTIDREFVGFGEVDVLTHGDDFVGEAATQPSLLQREVYHVSMKTAADRVIAGRLFSRHEFTVEADNFILDATRKSFRSGSPVAEAYSLSTQTKTAQRPQQKTLLRSTTSKWQALSRNQGAFFVRRLSESVVDYPSDPSRQIGSATFRQTIDYRKYDQHNISAEQLTHFDRIEGPLGLEMPGSTQTVTLDFDASRKTLAGLGIIDKPSRMTTKSGSFWISDEQYRYYAETGLLKSSQSTRFSRLHKDPPEGGIEVPQEIAADFLPEIVRMITYEYDDFGNPIGISDDLGPIESAVYDTDGIFATKHITANPAKSVDKQRDLITSFMYGTGSDDSTIANPVAKGRLASFTNPLGIKHAIAYDKLGRRTSLTGSDGSEEDYSYRIGANGAPTMILTKTKRYTQPTDVPEGESQWIFSVQAHQADGTQLATLENDESGTRIRITDFQRFNRNKSVVFRWTPYFVDKINSGPAASIGPVSPPCANSASVDICAIFLAGQVPEPIGNRQDAGGLSITVPTDEQGQRFFYDALGRVRVQVLPSGKTLSMVYFPWGVQTRATHRDLFDGEVIQFRLEVSNPLGTYAIIESPNASLASAIVTRFKRDPSGELTHIFMPGETEPRRAVFNSEGMLEHFSGPGLGAFFNLHDVRGREKTHLRKSGATGNRIDRAYDMLDRPLWVKVDGDYAFRYTYDERGDVWPAIAGYPAPINDPLGQVTEIISHDRHGIAEHRQRLGYDRQGRIIRELVDLGDDQYSIARHYSLDGAETKNRNSFGVETYYALGRSARLTSISVSSLTIEKTPIIESVQYNERGQLQTVDYRAGARTKIGYDPATLLVNEINSSYVDRSGGTEERRPLQKVRLEINQNGSVNKIKDSMPKDVPHGYIDRSGEFRYNWKDELVRSTRYGETVDYSYTEASAFYFNGEFDSQPIIVPSDSPTSLVPARTGAKRYSFDNFGQLQQSPRIKRTEFDAFGRLVLAETATATIRYGYDSDGARTYVHRTANDGSVDQSLFPLHGMIVEPKGRESHVYIGDTRLARVEHGTDRERWFYYLKDHLDSTDILMTEDGLPVERMFYLPYGTEKSAEELSTRWRTFRAEQGVGLPRGPTRHRFTGNYLDQETGLYMFGARYYDPVLGRFISADPVFLNDPALCASKNRECGGYIYALNNPMKVTDPNGELGQIAIGALIGGGMGLAIEGARQYMSGQFDAKSLAAATAGGAISGAVAGATFGSSLLAGAGAKGAQITAQSLRSAASSVAGGVSEKVILGQKLTLKTIGRDALSAAIPMGGGKASKIWTKGSGKTSGSFFGATIRSSGGPANSAQGALLKEHLRQAEKYGQGSIKKLQNGRIRYYGESIAPRKQGEMAGWRTVREWNSKTGQKRTWHETLDHGGSIRQVRPVTGGPKTHYTFDKKGNFSGSW